MRNGANCRASKAKAVRYVFATSDTQTNPFFGSHHTKRNDCYYYYNNYYYFDYQFSSRRRRIRRASVGGGVVQVSRLIESHGTLVLNLPRR